MARKKLASRIIRRLVILLAVVVLPLAWGLFSSLAQEKSPSVEIPVEAEPTDTLVVPLALTKLDLPVKPTVSVDELRKRYPFRSLRARLAYEASAKHTPTPKLSHAVAERLEQDDQIHKGQFWNARRRSLASLHSAKAEEFVSRQGQGFGRWRIPESPSYLPVPSGPPVRLATVPPLAPRAGSPERVLLSADQGQGHADPLGMPSQQRLLQLHRRGFWNFLSPARFGYVKDVDHVAGFASHKFLHEPNINSSWPEIMPEKPKTQEPWLLRRLELVSLLKHDEPVVYLSDDLPNLEKLDQVETRPLTTRERRSLATLYDGEDLAIEAQANLIHMVGALRASNQCLECHSVERGTLLGAFTYELQRDPPIEDPQLTRSIVR